MLHNQEYHSLKLIKQSSIVKQAGCFPVQVVLFETDGAQPFVTWMRCLPDDDDGTDPYNITGHYFETLDAALDDYAERVATLARRL